MTNQTHSFFPFGKSVPFIFPKWERSYYIYNAWPVSKSKVKRSWKGELIRNFPQTINPVKYKAGKARRKQRGEICRELTNGDSAVVQAQRFGPRWQCRDGVLHRGQLHSCLRNMGFSCPPKLFPSHPLLSPSLSKRISSYPNCIIQQRRPNLAVTSFNMKEKELSSTIKWDTIRSPGLQGRRMDGVPHPTLIDSISIPPKKERKLGFFLNVILALILKNKDIWHFLNLHVIEQCILPIYSKEFCKLKMEFCRFSHSLDALVFTSCFHWGYNRETFNGKKEKIKQATNKKQFSIDSAVFSRNCKSSPSYWNNCAI